MARRGRQGGLLLGMARLGAAGFVKACQGVAGEAG